MKKITAVFCLCSILLFFNRLPCFAVLTGQSFTITRTNYDLKSTIDSKYNGFEYTLKNMSSQKLFVKNLIIENSTLSNNAYLDVKRNGWAASGVTFLYGWNYAFPTLGLSLVASVVAWPVFLASSISGNIGAKMEANRFKSDYLKSEYFRKGEQKKFKLLSQKGTIPVVTILLEDEDGNNYSYKNSYFGVEFLNLGTNEEYFAKIKADSEKNKEIEEKKQVVNDKEENKLKKEERSEIKDDTKEKVITEQENSGKNKDNIEELQKDEDASVQTYKKYNTGVTIDPNIKVKQQFEQNKNFVSF